jgi:Kef-type K+ transport system membrane component KefB
VLFARPSIVLVWFVAISAVVLAFMPVTTRLIIRRLGHRVSEPEIKFVLVVLLGLAASATAAGSEAVLPAYLAGLVIAGVFMHDRVLIDRMRSIAFALLTPFFFLRAGSLISAQALVSGAGVIALLLAVKLIAKVVGVWPTSRAFGIPKPERTYLTLLMATGLTFGSIAALFGFTNGFIDRQQYSELVTVVILSAFVPTVIAQRFFQPTFEDVEEEEALGAEDVGPIRPHHVSPTEGARDTPAADSQGEH